MLTVWTKLPNEQPDDASSRRAPRERSRFRRSFGIKLRSGGGAIAAGVGPLPWYSERVGWGFLRILSVLIWPGNGKGLGILLDPF